MAKSKLQQEYAKQLRLLQRRIKALEKQGHTFNPKKIEAITKRKSRPTSKDIEKLKSYKAKELKKYTVSRETFNYQETDNLTKYPASHTPRTPALPYIAHPREKKPPKQPYKKLTKEQLLAHQSFRAKLKRLEKQGFTVPQDIWDIVKENFYNSEYLRSFTREEIIEMLPDVTLHHAFAPTEYIPAIEYEQRLKEEAQEKRIATREKNKAEKEAFKKEITDILTREKEEQEIKEKWDDAYNKFIPHTPEELDQWLAKNKERERYDKFKEGTMIQTIESKIQEVVNYVYSEEWLTIKLQASADTLQGLWWDILINVEYPDNPDKYIPYEEYLQQHENEIMTDLDIILHYEATGMEGTEQSFINVMNILNQGTVTLAQSQSLGEMHER